MFGDFGYFEEDKIGKTYDLKLLRRILPFVRPHAAFVMLSVGLIVLVTFLELALPYLTKVAIDRYIVPEKSVKSSQISINNKALDAKQRYLDIDISIPENKKILQAYENIGIASGTHVFIPFEQLSRISKHDLFMLRHQDRIGIARYAVILLAIVILTFVISFVQVLVMEYAGQRIMHDLRMYLYKHIQTLPIAFFSKNPIGRLVTRATNDVSNMNELFTSVLSVIFTDIFLLIGIAVMLLVVNLKLALVSFAILPLVLFVSFYYSGKARDAFRDLRIKVAQINTRFSETIEGLKVIQLFNQEAQNEQKFKTLNHENYLAGMQQVQVFAVFMPMIELLGSVAVAVIIFYGGYGLISHYITLGELVLFISYMKMFFRPIRDLAEKHNIMQNALASAERIFMILDTRKANFANHIEDPDKALDLDRFESLAFDQVSFSYDRQKTVLNQVSFKVDAGQTLAIVGRTGAGKTSIINLIIRFYNPDSGRILVNGQPVSSFDKIAFRKKIGLVMQDPYIFYGTLKENILQGKQRISDQEMERIVNATYLTGLVERLPQGLDTLLSEGGKSLSSGQRQLISIARALARKPELILMDEATSHVDSETEQHIQNALKYLMQGRTAVVVAHRLMTVQKADQILVVKKGRIIEAGDHSMLMKKQGYYFRMHQLQSLVQ